MSTTYRYALPVEETEWKFDGHTDVAFTWEYDDNRDALLQLYAKGKKQQWDAAERIDWSQDLDPENPMLLDDRSVAIYGSDVWNRMASRLVTLSPSHGPWSVISEEMRGQFASRNCSTFCGAIV